MQSLAHIRYIAQQYPNLQGLTSVPFGLFFLELVALGMGWLRPPAGLGIGTLLLVSIGIVCILTVTAGIYYRLSFGRARPLRRVQLRDILFISGLAVAIVVSLFIDLGLHPGVSVVEWSLAGGIFLYYWPFRRFALHYLVLAAVIAGIGLFPLFGGFWGEQNIAVELVRLALCYGLLCLFGGIFDHLLLVRVFKQTSEDAS
jgi:hypothetical protein